MISGLAAFAERTPPEAIGDLRRRLHATRWPDAPADAGWELGTDVGYLRELVTYWADDFDWAGRELELLALPRFRAGVGAEALGVHFVHAKAPDRSRNPLPIVLCHGWPDSFWRYTKVIDALIDPGRHGGDPSDAFDVVVPDMPGYGYSDRPTDAPLNSIGVAALWAELMAGLGYERYGAAGGDIGSHVARYLALDDPGHVVAVHRMDAGLPSPRTDPSTLSEAEQQWLKASAAWSTEAGAYIRMHVTRPQTAAFGLTDSPVGLAAWIVEKLRAWSDCDGDIERVFTKDEILTVVSMYWFTGTIGSSMRMYRANAAIDPAQLARRVEVPSGFSIYPADIARPPREWLERSTNLARATYPDRGGHFAPFEQPDRYIEELRTFFRPFRRTETTT
jgi:pimeloyl-ACP methyl ester carboxylesterase